MFGVSFALASILVFLGLIILMIDPWVDQSLVRYPRSPR